ncbi:MAG: dCTP deaminase [Candidatus Saccharibacteria bacterium]
MTVYSDIEIKKAIKDGTIVSVPYNEDHVAGASLDVTLGHYYYRQNINDEAKVYNPFDELDVERYFEGPYEAVKHKDWCDRNGCNLFTNIPEDHPIIVIQPGERILAHTHEFVGIRTNGGAANLMARSSWGRNGISVCFDAGWIDPGYINRLTLEIYNLNKTDAIVLPVGERIGQLVFFNTSTVETDYSDGRGGFSGKYQHSADLDELIKTWAPKRMLPTAFKDKRIMPEKIDGLSKEIK